VATDDKDRAKKILEALTKRPALYYDLTVQIRDRKVMGAWGERHKDVVTIHERLSEHGGCQAWVHADPDRIHWTVICGPAGDDHQGVDVGSVAEGMDQADTYLREQGVLLAGEDG